MIATTGGYIGDAPPYQGHVAVVDAASGRLLHVWNSLCSDRHELIEPASCGSSDSAIWGRAGAVVVPGSHDLLVATGNAPWNGSTDWGDAVVRLPPAATGVLGNYTPANTEELNATDRDLGSTSPVYLTATLIAQGGKDGKIRLLSAARLRGSAPHRGGELQEVSTPSGADLFTAPAVWRTKTQTWLIAADNGGTGAWVLKRGRLHGVWRNATGGTSPVIAGGLLWVYGPGGGLRVYRPGNGRLVATLDAGPGHWNSPIVVDGRVALPEGNANDHATSGRPRHLALIGLRRERLSPGEAELRAPETRLGLAPCCIGLLTGVRFRRCRRVRLVPLRGRTGTLVRPDRKSACRRVLRSGLLPSSASTLRLRSPGQATQPGKTARSEPETALSGSRSSASLGLRSAASSPTFGGGCSAPAGRGRRRRAPAATRSASPARASAG